MGACCQLVSRGHSTEASVPRRGSSRHGNKQAPSCPLTGSTVPGCWTAAAWDYHRAHKQYQIILAPRQSVWQTTRAPLANHKQRGTLVQEDGGLVKSLGKLKTQLGTGSIRGTAWRYLLRSHFHCWCLKVSGL